MPKIIRKWTLGNIEGYWLMESMEGKRKRRTFRVYEAALSSAQPKNEKKCLQEFIGSVIGFLSYCSRERQGFLNELFACWKFSRFMATWRVFERVCLSTVVQSPDSLLSKSVPANEGAIIIQFINRTLYLLSKRNPCLYTILSYIPKYHAVALNSFKNL